jgi:hypothetical protein
MRDIHLYSFDPGTKARVESLAATELGLRSWDEALLALFYASAMIPEHEDCLSFSPGVWMDGGPNDEWVLDERTLDDDPSGVVRVFAYLKREALERWVRGMTACAPLVQHNAKIRGHAKAAPAAQLWAPVCQLFARVLRDGRTLAFDAVAFD